MRGHHGFFRPAEDPQRREWQNPEEILIDIGIQTGFSFVDIGCGGGFFAIPAARMVGPSGQVYGVDTNPGAIASLQATAMKEGLHNIFLTVGTAEDSIIGENLADLVFIGTALHDFQDASRVLINARTMLKPSGRLANLDWKKEPMDMGPPLDIRFDQDKAKSLIEQAGFTVESIHDIGHYFYLVMARP